MHGPIFWIVVGLIAGALAKAVVPGREGGGCLGSIVVGLVGSVVGGFLFQVTLGHSYTGFMGSTLVAFAGAVVFLIVWHWLTRRGGT